MSRVLVELDLPRDRAAFQFPPALSNRLQDLLRGAERPQAEARTGSANMLAQLKLRAARAALGSVP